jgi:predicted  nucleic acid-binding Zn-ribbon protein
MTADSAALKHLLKVQDMDRSIDALRHQRTSLPEFDQVTEVEASGRVLAKKTEEVEAVRHELERTQKRFEDEVALLEDRVQEENGKLYGGNVTGAKDLQALQDEIKGLKDRQGLVEDSILEVMEAAEPVDATLGGLAADKAGLEAELARLDAAIQQRQTEIEDELVAVGSQRSDQAAGLDASLVDEYDRIRSQPGRIGVAKLVGSTCHGCHLELPAMEIDRLRKLPDNELIHCEECGCILVRT